MKNSYFLDTSYAIALIVSKDPAHQRAVELSFELERNSAKLVTTRAVLLEIGNSLSRQQIRPAGVKLLEKLELDSRLVIVELTAKLYGDAFQLFRDRLDKEWGMVDCVSFVVMREQDINDALTTDEHFIQAGFRALLREDN